MTMASGMTINVTCTPRRRVGDWLTAPRSTLQRLGGTFGCAAVSAVVPSGAGGWQRRELLPAPALATDFSAARRGQRGGRRLQAAARGARNPGAGCPSLHGGVRVPRCPWTISGRALSASASVIRYHMESGDRHGPTWQRGACGVAVGGDYAADRSGGVRPRWMAVANGPGS